VLSNKDNIFACLKGWLQMLMLMLISYRSCAEQVRVCWAAAV
jgi:hypothetical protein